MIDILHLTSEPEKNVALLGAKHGVNEEEAERVCFRYQDPIPECKSRLEEAEFWDTHDAGDYWDDRKPVKLRVADKIEHGKIVWFDVQPLQRYRAFAEPHGIDPSHLGGSWIADCLEAEVMATPRR